MRISRHFSRPGRRTAAFSLVEIALALGIVGFALVGIVGAIPVAVNNERLSIAQSRTASIANVVFTNFRTQPFGSVQYLDTPVGGTPPASGGLDLNSLKTDPTTDGPTVTFYAAFDETISPTPATVTDERRLHFTGTAPASGPFYQIVLRFDNKPVGMLAPYSSAATGSLHAEGNAIEATIFQTNFSVTNLKNIPKEASHFSSVIANRL